VDEMDQCPDEPETVNGVDDDDGCPDQAQVEVKADRILIGEKVFFDFDQARLRSAGRELLKEMARLLETHPEYLVISIEGYADKVGSEEYNRKLSLRRAESVRRYLFKLGVPESHLIVKGLGATGARKARPDSEARRVEFVIEQIDETLAEMPVAPETLDAKKTAPDSAGPAETKEDVHE